MDTIKINKRSVKMVAHRGLSGIETENTNAAFVAAGNRSYFGIETDVDKTADGIFVLIHDHTTQRLADMEVCVQESTYEQLQNVILKNFYGDSERSDLRIPLLSDYIEICKKYEKVAVLELKVSFTYSELEEIVKIIEKDNYIENTIFISFFLNNLIDLRKICPSAKAQFLIGTYDDELLKTLIEHKLDLDIYYEAVTEENVKILHENNIEINCWTCDNAEEAEKLVDYGVDYITSNILE